MKRTKILILGLTALAAASLCLACQAPPPVVPAEKVIALDDTQFFDVKEVALCDFAFVEVCVHIKREAVSCDAVHPSIAGRSADTFAKVSAHGRTCRWSLNEAEPVKPPIDYSQRV